MSKTIFEYEFSYKGTYIGSGGLSHEETNIVRLLYWHYYCVIEGGGGEQKHKVEDATTREENSTGRVESGIVAGHPCSGLRSVVTMR